MNNQPEGYSRKAWLIIVVLLLIIAAIVISNILRTRIAGDRSAVDDLRTLNNAEITYASTYNAGYSLKLSYLAAPATSGAEPTSTAAGLIDSVLAGGVRSGYTFTYSAGPPDSLGRINSYRITADPLNDSMGTLHYYTDQSGVIRQNDKGTAGSTDSPIGG